MLPWFLRDRERLDLERRSIDELARSASWLIGTEWGLGGDLYLDAIIRAHDHDYDVRVSFPALYPDAPSVVRPRNLKQRVSTHQYGGADGPLCLEWGPDNWHRGVTAAQMLESAYRLFDTENPLGEDRPKVPVVAPSRHKLTVGQELRGEKVRWYLSKALDCYLAAQPAHSVGSFKFSFRKAGDIWIALVHETTPHGAQVWRDAEIPKTLPGAEADELYVGVWFKTDLAGKTIGEPGKLSELQALLAGRDEAKLLATDSTSSGEGFRRAIAGVLVIDRAGDLHFFVVLSGETVIRCSKVQSDATPIQSRAPQWDALKVKTVGVVGLGSAGSKIAMTLARMGVSKFYFVDHDVLLPENLQRHALDWQGIAQHKVDAMAAAIRRVAADAQVDVCRLHLTGQESNAVVSGALKRLSECDLLVDATADGRVFNLLSAVAGAAARPMVWLEIFGGGIGGLVARSRPGVDPGSQDMRGAFLEYCSEHPDKPTGTVIRDYAIQTEEGKVLVASDADAAVIAHQAARLACDCFVSSRESNFPYSMYLIGLAKAWVFEAPFATIPISMESYPVSQPKPADCADLGQDNAAFLLELINKHNDAPAPAP